MLQQLATEEGIKPSLIFNEWSFLGYISILNQNPAEKTPLDMRKKVFAFILHESLVSKSVELLTFGVGKWVLILMTFLHNTGL